MMRKYSLLILLACLSLSVHAQKKSDTCSEEEFQAKKEAYITQKAELTQEEASQFFPIYFELQKLKKEINGKAWEKSRKGKNPGTTEAEYEDILNGFIEASEKNNQLDKEYLAKYQKILSNKKIYQVFRAEISFNRNMLKIMQKGKEQNKK